MKIAIDIDEVVADFYGVFLKYYNLRFGKKIILEEIKNYKSSLFGETQEERNIIFNDFFNSKIFNEMGLKKGAFDGVNFLDDNFEVVFVTARNISRKSGTVGFFLRHFPNRKFEIIFAGNERGDGDKLEMYNKLGIDLIIEDSGETCLDSAKRGVSSILLNKPWNQKFKHDKIHKCFNWDEILDKIKEFDDEKIF